MIKVSVIMAAYNSEKFIGESIASIIKQSYPHWELIICDDCSSDNTFKIASEFAKKDTRIKVIKNLQNKRAAYSRNRCIEIAQGKYIAIQDADDISLPNRLEKQVNFLNRNTNFGFVGSQSSSFDEQGIWKTTNPSLYPVKKDFLRGSPFTHASIMFRTESIKRVNGYRVAKETTRGQDTDMIMRMYALNIQGANLQEELYLYREDLNALKRRTIKFRLQASLRNIKRFRELKLMPLGYVYAFRPLLAGLIPKKIYRKIIKKNFNFFS